LKQTTTIEDHLENLSLDERIAALVVNLMTKHGEIIALLSGLMAVIAHVSTSRLNAHDRLFLAGHLRDLADTCEHNAR
jgi:hypothetical protein